MFFETRYFFTDSARRTESFWLYSSGPTGSAGPMAITPSRLTPPSLAARSSSLPRASGLMSDLSKSNSTSAAKVTFSATGLGSGFGASTARGLNVGSGAGAGAGAGGGGLGASCVAQAAKKKARASGGSQRLEFIFVLPSKTFFGSMLLDRILPQLQTAFQALEQWIGQRAAAHQGSSRDPHVAHVVAPGGVDELRDHVIAGLQLGSAQVDGDQVGGLSRLDRAERRLEAERARTAEGRRAQRELGGHRLRGGRRRLCDERRGSHLLGHFEPVFARRTVRGQGQVHPLPQKSGGRREAAPEV